MQAVARHSRDGERHSRRLPAVSCIARSARLLLVRYSERNRESQNMDGARLRAPLLQCSNNALIQQTMPGTLHDVHTTDTPGVQSELHVEYTSAGKMLSPRLEWVLRRRSIRQQSPFHRFERRHRFRRTGERSGTQQCQEQNEQAHKSGETEDQRPLRRRA